MRPGTLLEAMRSASAVTGRGLVFLDGELAETRYAYREVVAAAEARARHLLALGLVAGDRVGLIIPEGEDFVLTFLGAIRAGIVPVPMYPPLALGALDGYMASAARILSVARARTLITTSRVSQLVWSLVDRVESLEDVVLADRLRGPAPSGTPLVEPSVGPDDLCFLQFTSGSTADPKGVMVTHGNLCANAGAIMDHGLVANAGRDVGVTWLPLYHDMGLIGFVVAPLLRTVEIVFIPTLTFVKRPTVWMETMNKYRGTLSFAPNFAFALAARRAAKQANLDLSCIRMIGCGAEPINADTIRAFTRAFAPAGLGPNVVMPAYGMAEATLAMAFEPVGEPFRTVAIDREAYEHENVARPVDAPGLELVSCGRAFPGHAIGIMDAAGALLPEGRVGEIVFRGPSVTKGYFENAAATAQAIKDGWLHTGDLGFVLDGRVYVSGRQKDIVILNGRNYYPQAIEWEVEKVDGVRKGNVVAFAVRGEASERLVVVAETKRQDHEALRATIVSTVQETLGVAPAGVVLVPAGSLPKTSSGKLQRKKTRAQYEDGTLGRAGIRTMGAAARRSAVARHFTISVWARIRHKVRRIKRVLPLEAR